MTEEPLRVPIGTACRVTGLSPRQMRYFEQAGLLAPEYRNGRRYYSEDDVRRAGLIKRLRERGYGLKRIGTILAGLPTATVRPPGDAANSFEDVKLFFRER